MHRYNLANCSVCVANLVKQDIYTMYREIVVVQGITRGPPLFLPTWVNLVLPMLKNSFK